MFCCIESHHPYSAVRQGDSEAKSPLKRAAGQCQKYPGTALRSPSTDVLPDDSILVKTGGNAWQAVPQNALGNCRDIVAVTVLEHHKPGQMIHVAAPDGRMVQVVIPEQCQAGHIFLVNMATPLEMEHIVVTGVPVEAGQPNVGTYDAPQQHVTGGAAPGTQVVAAQYQNDVIPSSGYSSSTAGYAANPHESSLNQKKSSSHVDAHGRVLVHVPPGALPGDKVRVRLPDKREIDVTVPFGLTETEFYIKPPPKKQNWHDNPLVYGVAPVATYLLL